MVVVLSSLLICLCLWLFFDFSFIRSCLAHFCFEVFRDWPGSSVRFQEINAVQGQNCTGSGDASHPAGRSVFPVQSRSFASFPGQSGTVLEIELISVIHLELGKSEIYLTPVSPQICPGPGRTLRCRFLTASGSRPSIPGCCPLRSRTSPSWREKMRFFQKWKFIKWILVQKLS